MPTATYWIKPEGSDRYTLKLELSDDPGETTMLGQTLEACQAEIECCRSLGYEIVSGVRNAFALLGAA